MSRGTAVGDLRVPQSALRLGIIDPRLYDDLFFSNFQLWVTKYNACPLSRGMSGDCSTSTFNVFPPEKNPMIEWSDVDDSTGKHTLGEVGEGAVLDVAVLPYMKHRELASRPTLMMFLVTGHVMAAIYFVTPRGGELHLLNPWPLGIEQQLRDVYALLEARLPSARKITIVDVASQVESYLTSKTGADVSIDLQTNEKLGFCTLWVGIISQAVLTVQTPVPPMTYLQSEVTKSPPAVGYQLSQNALNFYSHVYTRLLVEKEALVKEASKAFLDTCPEGSAAVAVVNLAAKAARGGKRIRRRRTFRKRKLRWNSHPVRQSTFFTSRRRKGNSRRGGKGSSAF
jgi:hypothetical protein